MLPFNTQSKEVFPYDRDKDLFQRIHTQAVVPMQDANRVLSDLESVERDRMTCNYLIPVIIAIVMTLILIILGILMLINNTWSEFLGWVSLGIFIIGFIAILYFTWKKCKDHDTRMNLREYDFKNILDNHNAREFSAKGINWKTGPMGAWVEANKAGNSPSQSAAVSKPNN